VLLSALIGDLLSLFLIFLSSILFSIFVFLENISSFVKKMINLKYENIIKRKRSNFGYDTTTTKQQQLHNNNDNFFF